MRKEDVIYGVQPPEPPPKPKPPKEEEGGE